ncbi:hypothetical protein FOYG_04139 [Fusarium oxysporum NRRL 32931]|uniref:Uncharacterized protein n=1 Tax=Fusarium oxysporum NRRL 32931 TaxID=660029 RepID=W9IQH7_FUSOX|nr:hypothetical protein FOYG_04139 [Fusarium oxysporum NRRL 32931]
MDLDGLKKANEPFHIDGGSLRLFWKSTPTQIVNCGCCV